jgi:hypothetical protein
MVCQVCKAVLEEHDNYRWKGTYDLAFDHHRDQESLQASAKKDCCICRALLSKFNTLLRADDKSQNSIAGKKREAKSFLTQASLSYDRQWSAYRLDIKLNEQYNLERVGSFLLTELRKSVHW